MPAALSLQIYHRLRRGLQAMQQGRSVANVLGLGDAQWAGLVGLAWRPGRPLRLVFGDSCSLPSRLRSDCGACLPVEAVRSGPGRLHTWIRIQHASMPSLAGTMTALVRQPRSNRLYALTAGHVIGAAASARPGDRIILQDQASSRGVNARLDDWTPSFYAGKANANVDAGLARLPLEQAQELIEIGLPLPTGVDEVQIGDRLSLRTRGTAIPLQVTGLTTVLLSVGEQGRQVQLVDGLGYLADTAPVEGDSGAPLWDGRERLAAMHVGGELADGLGNGVAIPIRRALDWCGCTALERGEPLLRPPATLAPAALAAIGPPPPTNGHDRLALARTLWGEARGEGISGMEAVACVVMNRVRRQTYWGRNVFDVCCKPYQFSCWNANDPNSSRLMRLTAESSELSSALDIAGRAIGNRLADTTAGATHYHARRLAPLPGWARGHIPCAVIGNHLFYNDID